MICLRLFLAFLEIGAVSFRRRLWYDLSGERSGIENGWLTESEFISFIAVSESTPGPLAVNMATFVGSSHRVVFWGLWQLLQAWFCHPL
ncbi:MAG: chromate transporter [Blautia sp.]